MNNLFDASARVNFPELQEIPDLFLLTWRFRGGHAALSEKDQDYVPTTKAESFDTFLEIFCLELIITHYFWRIKR
jgi:hypothetical protein